MEEARKRLIEEIADLLKKATLEELYVMYAAISAYKK